MILYFFQNNVECFLPTGEDFSQSEKTHPFSEIEGSAGELGWARGMRELGCLRQDSTALLAFCRNLLPLSQQPQDKNQ